MLIASLQSFAVILLVACCKKKRKKKAKKGHSNPIYACSELDPAAETVTVSHSNSTYDVIEYKRSNQTEDHEYFMMDKITTPGQDRIPISQSDLAEQWSDNTRNKDLVDQFADDPTYDCLDPPQKGNHTLRFANQSHLSSSET